AHYVAALSTELACRHDVHVFAGNVETGEFAGVQVHKVPVVPWGLTAPHASFLAALPFSYLRQSQVRGGKFDIVHGQGTFNPFANVVTAHFIESTKRRLLASLPAAENRRSLRSRIKQWDSSIYDLMAARLERHSHHTLAPKLAIAISQNVKEDLLREFDMPAERVVVVPNGVDVDRFHPRNRLRHRGPVRVALGLAEEDIVALFVGGDWERKGLSTCVQAVRSYPDDRLKLLVVGDGDPAAFVADEERRGADRRFVFISRRDPKVERYFAAADLLLFPSRYEPFGLVILEALASGLPVVTSACAGASEYITHGATGLLLQDPTDPAEVVAAVSLLLDSPDLSGRLACDGRRLATQFTWERIASRTEEAYQSALDFAGQGQARA
ncbi:MAG: glycosyltransferase family 4 protein, partial [Gemmatimonadales bacterium]